MLEVCVKILMLEDVFIGIWAYVVAGTGADRRG